jgi:hypothetical protein
MMLQDTEFARRAPNGSIEVRPAGMRLAWELDAFTTLDGHSVRGSFACIVRILSQPNELKMLEEALLGSRPSVTLNDTIRYFTPSLLSAARKHAAATNAEQLLSSAGNQELLHALMESGKAVAFGCGMEILQPAQIDLDCPSLDRQRLETLERKFAEKRTEDQVDHLRRSAELFKQFESIRAAAPELAPGEVLARIGVGDQPELLRSLLQASASSARKATLYAVAGSMLIKIQMEGSTQLIPLNAELGPARSVRPGPAGALLVGCRDGVLRISADDPNTPIVYRSPTQSQLGFNSACIVGDKLWAAHSEAGLMSWDLNSPGEAHALDPSAFPGKRASSRNLTAQGNGKIAFCSGSLLISLSNEGKPLLRTDPSDSEIVAAIPQANRLITIHEDGMLCARDLETFGTICQQRRQGPITAAAALPWLGDVRLLLASENGPISCLGLDDEMVSQYASVYSGFRIVAGAAHAVAAVTADRQRLVVWNSYDGRKPVADVHLYAAARHRVADIAFI